jgi:hypothetical protein
MVDKSDFGALEQLAASYCKARPRVPMYRKWLETGLVLVGLVGGGFGLGHKLGVDQGEERHLAEVDRLREAYRDNIYELAKSVNTTASAVQSAATQVDAAAATIDAAAVNAAQAAKQSKQAIKAVPFAIPVQVLPSPVISQPAPAKPVQQPTPSRLLGDR